MAEKWGYFPVGAFIKDANLTIVEVLEQGVTQAKTSYRVRYGCCGGTDTLTHAQIRKRERAKYQRCGDCGQARRTEILVASQGMPGSRDYPDLEIPMPDWPAPDITLPAGWIPYHGSKIGRKAWLKLLTRQS